MFQLWSEISSPHACQNDKTTMNCEEKKKKNAQVFSLGEEKKNDAV
jgi:hypothetical protein